MASEVAACFFKFGFVYRADVVVSDEAIAHRARLTHVGASVSDSLELDSGSIVELLRAAERGGRVSTSSPETPGTPSSLSLVPDSYLFSG